MYDGNSAIDSTNVTQTGLVLIGTDAAMFNNYYNSISII